MAARAAQLCRFDLHANKGEYQNRLNAYQRDARPCRRRRAALAGSRSTSQDDRTRFCPRCQS